MTKEAKDRPRPVDRHVGARLKGRRTELGMSQRELADVLGISHRQMQLYERGVNTIIASRLPYIAGVLHVSVDYFFEGMGRHPRRPNYALSEDTREFARVARKLPHDETVKFTSLANTITKNQKASKGRKAPHARARNLDKLNIEMA